MPAHSQNYDKWYSSVFTLLHQYFLNNIFWIVESSLRVSLLILGSRPKRHWRKSYTDRSVAAASLLHDLQHQYFEGLFKKDDQVIFYPSLAHEAFVKLSFFSSVVLLFYPWLWYDYFLSASAERILINLI